jgi:hypothetical protein
MALSIHHYFHLLLLFFFFFFFVKVPSLVFFLCPSFPYLKNNKNEREREREREREISNVMAIKLLLKPLWKSKIKNRGLSGFFHKHY